MVAVWILSPVLVIAGLLVVARLLADVDAAARELQAGLERMAEVRGAAAALRADIERAGASMDLVRRR